MSSITLVSNIGQTLAYILFF